MDKNQLEQVLGILPNYAVPCGYFRDKYALDLLARETRTAPQKVQTLKASRWARLIQKPAVKKHLAAFSDGLVFPERLENIWPENTLPFNYTLASWGTEDKEEYKWKQTTRQGYNLVFQLNLDRSVVDTFYDLPWESYFWHYSTYDHPISGKEETLAWARLDFDLEGNTLLIEELQSDLVRDLRSDYQWLQKDLKRDKPTSGYAFKKALTTFWEDTFAPYQKLWEEAILGLVLEFIDQQLGYRQVYMHTYESGCRLKNIGRSAGPPRSLYTQLPTKFGFERTKEHPDFLQRHKKLLRRKKQDEDTEWWRLQW